jgi:hypothetical protein
MTENNELTPSEQPVDAVRVTVSGSPEAVLEQLATTESLPNPVAPVTPVVTDIPPPPPAPEPWPAADQLSTRITSPTPTRRGLPITVWLAALLVPYAIGSTIAVAYLFQQQQRNKQPHILESIPDQGLYEDFLDGRRRENIPTISKAAEKPGANKIIPPNEPVLPEMQPIKLGETRRVGMLSITPKSVVKERLVYRYQAGKTNVAGDEALVLTLEVKNVGTIVFRPDDETFNRAFTNESKAPVYTFLELGKDRFYGIIADPTVEQLELPAVPSLLPGETAMIKVVAHRNGDGKKLAADAWQPGTSGIWRVHLRKGKEEITMLSGKKRSVWVTTVVPVEVSLAGSGKAANEPKTEQPQQQQKK